MAPGVNGRWMAQVEARHHFTTAELGCRRLARSETPVSVSGGRCRCPRSNHLAALCLISYQYRVKIPI